MKSSISKLLEEHFDTAFDAPEGIKKLREMILTLAMQGKLVEQDPNDPPARELLKEIEAEKQRLIKEKKIKKPKPLPPIKPEEIPYELPQGWEWVRLGEIGVWKSGSTPSRSNASYYGGDIPWVKSGEVKQGRIKHTEETITQRALDKCPLQINEKGSVLVAMYGANIGEVGILEIEATTNQAVCACKTYTNFDENYLLYLITSLKPYFLSQGAGAAQPNISREKIVSTVFPLPPLPEQQRIVARIDQLMARCDALEKLCKEREEKRLAVHAAAIKKLLDTPDNSAWNFIQQQFGELYTVKENVAELRKAILQLAVMGRLVPQDPNDPPASELLKEIAAEKQRLIAEKKIKKPKALPPIKPEEVPYELPQGWEWVRLQDVLDVRDGTHNSPKDSVGPDTFPLITSKNFSNGQIDFSDARMISAEDHFEISKRSKVERLDILFSMIGGNIGNQVIVKDDRDFSIKNVALFKYYSKDLTYPYFIKRFMEHLAADLQLKAVGGAQPFVSLGFLRNIVIGLPPANEQHRIVARIDQLMALCDTLDQQIDAATDKQTELLNAVMAQV